MTFGTWSSGLPGAAFRTCLAASDMELGLSDSDIGSILGMSNEMVRHYGKRARR